MSWRRSQVTDCHYFSQQYYRPNLRFTRLTVWRPPRALATVVSETLGLPTMSGNSDLTYALKTIGLNNEQVKLVVEVGGYNRLSSLRAAGVVGI